MGVDGAVLGMTLFNADRAEFHEIHSGLVAGLENGTLTPVVSKEMPLGDAVMSHVAVMEPARGERLSWCRSGVSRGVTRAQRAGRGADRGPYRSTTSVPGSGTVGTWPSVLPPPVYSSRRRSYPSRRRWSCPPRAGRSSSHHCRERFAAASRARVAATGRARLAATGRGRSTAAGRRRFVRAAGGGRRHRITRSRGRVVDRRLGVLVAAAIRPPPLDPPPFEPPPFAPPPPFDPPSFVPPRLVRSPPPSGARSDVPPVHRASNR